MTAPQQTEITERLLRIDDPTERKRFLSGNRTLLDLAVVEQLTSAVRRFIRSDPRRAMAIAEIARSVAHLMADPLADALSLRSIAEAHHAQNAYESALEAYDAAIAIYRTHGRELEATRIERNKIDVLMYMGRYQEALGAAARARDVAERLGENVLAAQIDMHVGNIHHRTDDFRIALTYYERARNVFVEAGDPFARALIDFNRANVLAQMNDFAHSEQLYKSARTTFVERDMRVLAAHADYSLAYLLYLQNAFVDAMTVLTDSRRLYTAAQDRRGAANCDLDLAELYLRVNLCEESMAAAEHARTEFTQLRLRYEEAKTTTILAANHLQLGRDQRALELFRHAEVLFRAEGNAVQVSAVAMCRADLLLQRGDPFSACRVIKSSLSVFEAHGAADRACDAELRLAIALRMQGASDLAWEAAERALSRLAEADRPWLSYRVQHLIARMLWERGEIRAAQEHLDRALSEIERLWMDLRIDEFRVPFLRDKEVAFVDAVLLRLEAGGGDAVSAALGNVERCKSRAIVDLLTRRAAPRARVRPGVDPKLYEQYVTLRAELDWFWNRLGAGANDARLSARAPRDHFAPEIKRRERALAELRTQLKSRDPEFADVRGFGSLDIAALQQKLAPDEVMLEYFFAGEELLIFCISRELVHLERSAAGRWHVQEHLEGLRFQISKFLYGEEYQRAHRSQLRESVNRHLAALHDCLIAPLRSRLGEADLIIVPHGLLHYVPFHALVRAGAYLIEHHAVSYAPSAQVWMICQDRPRTGNEEVAVFGTGDVHTPFIRTELETIARLFPGCETRIGEAATRQALEDLARRARILHLAAHANFRTDNPMFSSLQLAGGPLTVFDVYNVDIGAELVTLSGCETGVNLVADGDELIGLSRAFLHAGAQSLLLSLWAVHDRSTAALMEVFYETLKRGERPRSALRAAQLSVLHQEGHPFYWAPFFVCGRG